MSSWGRILGVASLLGLVCCSLLTSLDGYTGGDPPDGAPLDTADSGGNVVVDGGSILQDANVPVVDGCSNTGCFDMPLGFSLVAFGATAKGTACPSGFATATDTVEGPTVQAAACTCGCSVTSSPTCPQNGTITGAFGTGGTLTCPNAGGDLVNTGCGTDGYLGPFSAGNEHKFTPPGPVGGACSTAATKDAMQVTYAAQGRVCQASSLPQCNNQVCPPQLGDPFGVCIAAAGDVACPSAFPKKHSIGVSTSFTCANNCTCSVTGKCKGKMNYYPAAGCTGTPGMIVTVDGTCQATVGADGGVYASHQYALDPISGVACTKGGTTTPSSPTLDQATTVCCAN